MAGVPNQVCTAQYEYAGDGCLVQVRCLDNVQMRQLETRCRKKSDQISPAGLAIGGRSEKEVL